MLACLLACLLAALLACLLAVICLLMPCLLACCRAQTLVLAQAVGGSEKLEEDEALLQQSVAAASEFVTGFKSAALQLSI